MAGLILNSHPELIKRYLKHIDLVAEAGYKNLICFSGNARGMDREIALQNAVTGLKQILPHAENEGWCYRWSCLTAKWITRDYLADGSALGY